MAEAGAKLAELHVNHEKQAEYLLQGLESKDVPLNWRVEKMKLSKDKTQLIYNDFLIPGGIPAEVFEYRLRTDLPWSGLLTNTRSAPTSAAASSTTRTALTTWRVYRAAHRQSDHGEPGNSEDSEKPA